MTYSQLLQRNIKLAYLSAFFTSLFFVIPIWVSFQRRVLTFSEIAFLYSFSKAIVIFLEMPTGALADLIGRKNTITFGWLFSGIASIYLGFASTFSMFLIAFAVIGIGEALVSGADTALIFDSFKELNRQNDYSKYASRVGFVYRTGLVIASLLGGYLYQSWIGLPYVAMGLTQLVAMVIIFFMIEPRIDSEVFTLKNYLVQNRQGFRELFKTQFMRKLSLYYVLIGGITWSCLTYFNLPFIKDVGFSEAHISWIFSLAYLISSLLLVLLTETDNLLTKKRVYLGFPILMFLALFPGFFAGQTAAVLMLIVIIFVGSSRFAILDKFINIDIASKHRATAISTLNMLVSLFVIIIVALTGKVQDIYNTKLIFSLLGISSLLFILPTGINLAKDHQGIKS